MSSPLLPKDATTVVLQTRQRSGFQGLFGLDVSLTWFLLCMVPPEQGGRNQQKQTKGTKGNEKAPSLRQV